MLLKDKTRMTIIDIRLIFPLFEYKRNKKALNIFLFILSIMKKGIVIGIFALLIVAGFIGDHFYAVEAFVDSCMTLGSDQAKLMGALRTGDASACDGLGFSARCKAWSLKDSSFCGEWDLDCIAIAKGNVSLCVEDSCRAMASGDSAYCATLGSGRELCESLVFKNDEFFVPNEEKCRSVAKDNVPWLT